MTTTSNSMTFEKVYVNFHSVVLNHITLRGVNRVLAEELANDTFIKAQKYYHTFDSERATIPTWLKSIANSLISDHFRTDHSNKFQPMANFSDAETGREFFTAVDNIQADTQVDRKETYKAIMNAFDNLNAKSKRIAELYFLKDMAYKEIADICELPLNNVCVTINRIRTTLQGQLKQVYAQA